MLAAPDFLPCYCNPPVSHCPQCDNLNEQLRLSAQWFDPPGLDEFNAANPIVDPAGPATVQNHAEPEPNAAGKAKGRPGRGPRRS